MKVTATPFAIALAAGMFWGGPVDAQVRARARARVAAPRTSAVVVVGGYRRPYYSPFYDPFFFDGFYRPYYRPFYWYPQAAYGSRFYDDTSSVRLQVSPRETEVYIDGYYAGTVDDFDGMFQRLRIEPGSHDVTLYLEGHRTVRQRIYVQPNGTFRLRYTMEALASGEVGEPRPVEPPPAQGGTQGAGAPRTGPPPRRDGPPQGGPGPQADRAGSGTFSIRVQPAGADITIDGERWEGPTDNERLVIQVAPGRHHVEVRREGYRAYETDVEVRGGETSTLNISLSRQ